MPVAVPSWPWHRLPLSSSAWGPFFLQNGQLGLQQCHVSCTIFGWFGLRCQLCPWALALALGGGFSGSHITPVAHRLHLGIQAGGTPWLLWHVLMVAVCRIYPGPSLKQLEVSKSFCKLQCGPSYLRLLATSPCPCTAVGAAHSLVFCLVVVLAFYKEILFCT